MSDFGQFVERIVKKLGEVITSSFLYQIGGRKSLDGNVLDMLDSLEQVSEAFELCKHIFFQILA